jgi:decaprenylphospho-beta-D-ribofuranose 2-oxidase
MAEQLLAGWGRTAFTQTKVDECLVGDVQQLVKSTSQLIARGLGRGYGDCAVSGGGTTVVSTRWDEQKSVGGVAEISAGTSLESVMREIIPTGWFVPVSPGTRFVSVGGAVASDIHGKNHHADGTFGSHVHSLTVVTADGSETICSPVQNPELFWATVGGMGLTGIITKVKFSLIPIETAFIRSEKSRFGDLDSLMSAMIIADRKFRYSVAWIDMLAVGKKMGRSVLSCGDHAKLNELDSKPDDPLHYSAKQRVSAPKKVPGGLLNRASVAAFNELWFQKSPRKNRIGIESISNFFHPLDGVKNWNHIYGPSGFVQYQFVVPDAQVRGCRRFFRF